MEFKVVPSRPRTPNGYRLVTLQEARTNFTNLKSRGILNDADTLRVLEGIIRGGRQVDISEWTRADNMLVFGHFPTEVSRTGSDVLRKNLYSKITVEDARKEDALRLSLHVGDIEVIHWLRCSTSEPHLERLTQIFEDTEHQPHLERLTQVFQDTENQENQPDDAGFSLIVKMIWLDSAGTSDEEGVNKILRYALKTKSESYAIDVDYTVAIFEVRLNKCKMNVVIDSAIAGIAKVAERTFISRRWEAKLIGMLTKLLSASTHPLESHIDIIRGRYEKVLKEAVQRGYVSLVKGLLDLRENINGQLVANVDEDGKTLLHYAAEWQRSKNSERVSEILFEAYKDSFGLDFVKNLDKRGRSVLHLASFSGRARFCKILLANYELQVNAEDYWQQNLLHYAAKGDYGERIVDAFSESFANLVHKKNKKGETPLHIAAIYGKIEMVKEVIVCLSDEDSVKTALKDADYGGRTPLHLAAREGQIDIVKELLMHGSDPLEERDIDGKTALHYAVMSITNVLVLVNTLLGHYKSEEDQALLLWVWAAGIGTADEIEGLDSKIKSYLKRLKENRKHGSLLKAAASAKNSRLTWELLNRGADIAELPDNAKFSWVRNQIEEFSVQGTDQPTLQDTLGNLKTARASLFTCYYWMYIRIA